jgi:hypothetical protein
MPSTGRRALVAVLVGVLGATVGIAGAGHAYLREWRRAVAWFAFVLGAGLVLLSVFSDPALAAESPSALPMTVTGPVLVLLVLSTLDAYRLALMAGGANDGDGPSCPYCGHEVDPDLDFCPWCTERFEDPPASDRAEPRARHDHGGGR